jgi:hypothetical protein
MYASNGIKRWRTKDAIDNKEDKFEMEMSFYGENGTDKNAQEIREFKEKWEAFDELIKRKVVEKAKEWLGMPKLDMTTLETVMYTPMVRVPKDKEGNELPYPSRVRAKIDREFDTSGTPTGRFLSNKKFKSEVLLFDESKNKLELNEDNVEVTVPKGSQVVSILELVYLSLSKTTISTKWKLVQAKVFRNKDSITSYAMLDDDNDVEFVTTTNIQEDLDTNEDTPKHLSTKEVVVGDDDDEESDGVADDEDEEEEEEEGEEEEEVVVVAPKPAVSPQVKVKARAKRGVVA